MLEIIVTSSILIGALILLRRLWKNKISSRLQYALWLLVVLRLLAPVTVFPNPLNVMNFLRSAVAAGEAPERSVDGYRIFYRAEAFRGEKETGTDGGSLTEEEIDGLWARGEDIFAQDQNKRADSGEQANMGKAGHHGEPTNPELSKNYGELASPKGRKSSGPSEDYAKWANRDTLREQISQQDKATSGKCSGTGNLESSGKEDEIFSLKEMEYLLEGGSRLNRFFLKGYARYTWYFGMAVLGVWMLVCNLTFRRRISKNRIFLGREGELSVYSTDEITSPCLLGILRPAIYLTEEASRNTRHREHALLHELTHYRHKDHLWAFIRSLCLVIYWFDPLVWLAAYFSARDCETACDEGVTYRIGEEQSREYGCTLIEMASSGKSLGLLRCATGFSARKRELRERISRIAGGRKRTGLLVTALVIACGTALAACTFGGAGEENQMGRYVETAVELPLAVTSYASMAQEGKIIRLASADAGCADLISEDGGVSFQMDAGLPAAYTLAKRQSVYSMEAASQGGWLLRTYDGEMKCILISVGGQTAEITELAGNVGASICYGGGYFYAWREDEILRVDPETGGTAFLLEQSGMPCHMAADDERLYILYPGEGLRIYDLGRGEMAAEQDEVLSEFLAGEAQYTRGAAGSSVVLYPLEDGVYALTHSGLYWHSLYGEEMELVIDGSMYRIGGGNGNYIGLAVLEGEERPEFLICYADGKFMRYAWDGDIPAVPEKSLRVYSVYEDSQVRQGVIAFREKYPEISVKYEVGINGSYGMTQEDALKNLATELAAGRGPDILVMDNIPYGSYVEKGVLMDLGELRQGMSDEEYFTSIIDGTGMGDGLYMMPVSFVIPVLAGAPEEIQGIESLTELGDLMEKAGNAGTGAVIGVVNEEEILGLLAQSSMGAWISQEGELNPEAIEEFLTQAKRIFELQKGVPEELRHLFVGRPQDETILKRRFGELGIGEITIAAYNRFTIFPESPFYGGYLGGKTDDFNGYLNYEGSSWSMLPGQNYGACMPVSLLAVNASAEAKEESRLFMEYMLSEEFQKESELAGFPVNRKAYFGKQKKPEMYRESPQTIWREDGGIIEIEVSWPTEEEWKELDRAIESVKKVNLCDNKVYEIVISQGRKILEENLSVEEGMEEIEKQLKLYLSE